VNSRFLGSGSIDWVQVIFRGGLWVFFGVCTPLPYFLARRFPLKRERLGRTLLIHSAGALLLCIAWTTLSVLLTLLISQRMAQEPVSKYYFTWIFINLPWSVFLYFTLLGSLFAFAYYGEMRERESQQDRLAAQLAEARLSALRMQLNPHFLFNSLNAITVLVRDHQDEQASRMLELVSGILRQVLQSERRQEVTLDEELRFIEKYLAIEQVRFSDRLQVTWLIEDVVRNALVPEFILQPLVENAIRHGVAKLSENGKVQVAARRSNDSLVLSVRDNGPGYQPASGDGVGLANTMARLKTLFGEAGELQAHNSEDGGAIVTVTFPLKIEVNG
jgi:two-component system LytT family sensor kinase